MGENISNKKEKLSSKASRILNSTMGFMVAYIGIMFFFYLTTALMGKLFGFDAQVYYYGVKFQLGRHRWTNGNVFWIWSFGTIFTFFIGFLLYYLYSYLKQKIALANIITLWGVIIAFSIVAAQGVLPCMVNYNEPSAYYTNLSIVFNYLALPTAALYVICIVFLFFLALFSSNISRAFLSFSYSFSKVNKRNRKRKYYFETVIVPYILASSLLLLFFYHTYQYVYFVYQNIVYLSVIGFSLIVSLLVLNISDMKQDEVLRYKNLQQVSASLFVVLMVMLIFLVVTWQGFYLSF